jgi:peptidoglycan/LPS O-acetylase OafA/YrhL
MRALFVLGVIAYHLWADAHGWAVDPGNVGVVGFFALSGYLITGLLIKEHGQTGRIHLPYFYARRTLRLLPALCFLLFVPGSPVSWVTGLEGVAASLFYVTNWLSVEPHWHLWHGYSPISHLWTLAVEEQFYVIWAPVMILLLRLRRQAATMAAAAIALVALIEPIFLSSATFNGVYFGTDTRSAALFCGALCAFIGSTDGWRAWRTSRWAALGGAAMVGAICWSCYALRQEGQRGLWNTGLIVCTIACALAVVFVVERPHEATGRFLSSNLLVAIGKRSYALYLWSYVLNTWLRDTGFFESFLVITTSFLAAEISYRYVELPALRFKHHFSPTAAAGVPARLEPREPVLVSSR